MAKYGAKRRPLSCEMNLSVIQEEVLDNLRQRGPARGHPRLKRRSLSVTNDFMLTSNELAGEGEDEQDHDGGSGEEERGEESWDGAAGHALLSFVDGQAMAGDGGDGGEDLAEGGGLSEGEEFSSDEGDGAETGGSASSGPPPSEGAFAAPPESTPEHAGLVPLLRTMSKTSLDNFEIDSTGRVVASRPRAARAQSVDLGGQKKGRRGSGVLAAFWKRTSNMMRRGFQEVDLAASLECAEAPSLLDRRSSYASNESLPGAYRVSPDNESSPFPVSRRGVNGLRQCDSLENVCDSSHEDQIENGLGLAAQPAAANAISLPHIHQLSDYDDDTAGHDTNTENDQENDLAKSTSGKPRQGKQGNKRSDKSKKTKLKRRRAYYRSQKDGRSKSLTHIDTLGESGMLLPGDEMGGRAGEPPTDKLGVPDPHSVRRRKLSLANKVTSCEYMMVVLEWAVDPHEEFVQASRGTTLREALERRGIDVSNVQVFAEGSRTPLYLNTDTYLLGGKTIRVRARDESRSPVRSRSAGTPGSQQPLRKTSGSHRSGQGRFLWGGASTEDCSPLGGEERFNGTPTSHDGSLKAAKSNKQNNRWSSIFPSNSKDPKMDSLVQQLDLYSRQGIPRQPHLLTCQTHHGDEEVLVEDSWRTLVESHEQLDDRQEQQQSAIWELVETEATYIHMLKVITDLFLACLCNLQNESLLCEIDTDKLFSNIQEIYAANLTFWREHVVRMLEEARSNRQPLDPTLLAEAFYKFDELFHPYTRYCLDQSLCQQYCKEKDHDNEYFKMYLAWCETQKECNRLRLMDILVQPMQRLTKYSLLLKAIAKKTNLEDHRVGLQDMISHVETFVSNVNSALRHKHEQERLRDIAKRIEAYDAVEARDDELERVVRNYSELNLTQPMPGCPEHLPRHILHHGDLRLRDPHTKMDVHVFLFTDLLLITKVTQRKAEKVKVIRPPYHVERLVLVELKDCTSIGLVSVNEWNVAVAAFTLQCPDQRTHRTWYDALKRAKEQYKEAQQARDVLVYDDMSSVGHLVPRSPRPGSSRASRVSSLAHSHSGSIDLNDPSPGSTHHPPSVDLSEKQDSKDTSIHKRLSWNYGQGPPPTSRDLGSDQGKLGRQKHAVKSISCESMHSSSGVSSTSSLHRSMGSELEALENIDDNELEDGEGTVVDLTVSDCTSLKISPHISTTYICHDTDITLGVCSQYITQPNNATEPTEGCENLVKIDVSETDPGISSVQITVTEGASSSSSNLSSTTPSSDGAPGKTDGLRMREILLNDASVEASDV